MRWIVFATALAATMPAHARTVHVHAGRLIDPERAQVLSDRRIDVVDGRVVAVVPWSPPGDDGAVIDWSAFTVLPGLIDCHTHIADGYESTADPAVPLKHSAADAVLKGARQARVTLAAGFTTVRDVGVYRALTDVALRDAIEAGDVPGPRMVVAGGYVTVPGGGGAVTGLAADVPLPADTTAGYVRSPDEARLVADHFLSHGADFLKLIATGAVLALGSTPGALELTPEEMKAACDRAAERGSYCIAHAHGAAGIKAAIGAGARSIEHASLADDEALALAKAKGVWLDMDVYNGTWFEEVGRKQGWPEEYLRKGRETTDAQRTAFAKAVRMGGEALVRDRRRGLSPWPERATVRGDGPIRDDADAGDPVRDHGRGGTAGQERRGGFADAGALRRHDRGLRRSARRRDGAGERRACDEGRRGGAVSPCRRKLNDGHGIMDVRPVSRKIASPDVVRHLGRDAVLPLERQHDARAEKFDLPIARRKLDPLRESERGRRLVGSHANTDRDTSSCLGNTLNVDVKPHRKLTLFGVYH